jgi:hypothetical protein
VSHATARHEDRRRPTLPALLLRFAGDRLFAGPDAAARRAGLTVIRGRRGLSRTYRDPRLDLLVRCPDCGGRDCAAYWLAACPTCHGTGRVLPAREPVHPGGRR